MAFGDLSPDDYGIPVPEYEDMNASTNGVARGTSITAAAGWTKTYGYSGAGVVYGILQNMEELDGTSSNYWSVRIVLDSTELFGSSGMSMRDGSYSQTYDLDYSGGEGGWVINSRRNGFRHQRPRLHD